MSTNSYINNHYEINKPNDDIAPIIREKHILNGGRNDIFPDIRVK